MLSSVLRAAHVGAAAACRGACRCHFTVRNGCSELKCTMLRRAVLCEAPHVRASTVASPTADRSRSNAHTGRTGTRPASTPAVKMATRVTPGAKGVGAGFARADDHMTAASPSTAMAARILRACLLLANSDRGTISGATMPSDLRCGAVVLLPSWDCSKVAPWLGQCTMTCTVHAHHYPAFDGNRVQPCASIGSSAQDDNPRQLGTSPLPSRPLCR